MFPLLVRAALSSKKPAASIWSLHRVLLLLPPSLKTSSNQYHHYYHHKVNVSSTETIKPSSPTPAKLATFKLSLIDNDVPPIYVPFIFFFFPPPGSTGPNPGVRRFETLKSSLAQTLTRFYPLAGRLSKSGDIDQAGSVPVVHCNDEGVPFSSATVDFSVAEFLRKRLEVDSLLQFLPFTADPIVSDLESAPQIAFRATAFPCGGLAIGVCMLHKIIDAATLADFMKLWSAVARSQEKTAAAAVGRGAYAHDRAATKAICGADSRAEGVETISAGRGRNCASKSISGRFLRNRANDVDESPPSTVAEENGTPWSLQRTMVVTESLVSPPDLDSLPASG
ncbi:unnamed protein product [Linum trigynum]|uniref:Uncharacterized protein n=1 Tax=Linum trigynum TaxID=586398 RepID=A0AAV2CN35_9ROSI